MPDVKAIERKIFDYKKAGLRLFGSSSFQSHSIVLLHILSTIDRSIPIYFLQTGYHFPETIAYKDEISASFGLNVIDLFSSTPKTMQKDGHGLLLFASDPEYCCYLNKVQPMEPILRKMDVWISGVRKDQTSNRAGFRVEETTPQGCLRYHPMIDWTTDRVNEYLQEHGIPRHPLEQRGYRNIGCEPCTRRVDPEAKDGREGRWFGMKKTECGLHTDLIDGR